MNVADSEVVASVMQMAGYEHTENLDEADAVFLNTCSIRDNAEQKIYHRLDALDAIKRNKRFSLSIIAEESDTSVIGQFGFCSSRTVDKYADYGYDVVEGAPLVKGTFAGRLILDALTFVDNESHVVVMARLLETVKGEGTPMTYDYYHRVVKGKAPKTAPTFVAERDEVKEEPKAAKRRYRCNMCGYVSEFDGEMPADYHCPLCRVDSSQFTALD